MNFIEGSICAPMGFSAAGTHCGIRKNRSKKDLALIFSDTLCDAAAVYTLNKVKGAPITVTKAHLKDGKAQAVICNSGNANTCNADGVDIANVMCRHTAKALKINEEDVIVASTGVIGQPLPVEPIISHLPQLASALSKNGASGAEEAIMTTDLRRKEAAVEFELGGKTCRIGGMAKGSGMIHPNMATMLCFVTTDASIDSGLLFESLTSCVQNTFNMVSVDGDTSTNDMVSVMASGLAGNDRITEKNTDYSTFTEALEALCRTLAKEIARDGEGATKLVECVVTGACCEATAKAVAKSVITSSLTKAAMFGADANWGRVLCAIGYAPVEVDVSKIDVSFASEGGIVEVCKSGAGLDFSEDAARAVLVRDEVRILVDLNDGSAEAIAYGCDLTYDYVKINGDYRT